jgi:hypothetical protein
VFECFIEGVFHIRTGYFRSILVIFSYKRQLLFFCRLFWNLGF